MGKERVAAVEDMGDGVDLVGSQLDFWADAAKGDVPPVIFTGAHGVKGIVVVTDKAVPALWVFPYPVLERLLDDFLLCLRRRGFLGVEHRLFVAILVINIIENAGVL